MEKRTYNLIPLFYVKGENLKVEARCDKCNKNVKVKQIYFAGTVQTVYLKCGHHIHFTLAGREKTH